MGQKVHPKSFRLLTTQKHLSIWYSDKKTYSCFIKEDFLIRNIVENFFEKLFTLSTVTIYRTNSTVFLKSPIIISVKSFIPHFRLLKETWDSIATNRFYMTPTQLEFYDKYIKKNFKKFIKSFLIGLIRRCKKILQRKLNCRLLLTYNFLYSRFEDASLLAKYIGNCLIQKIPYRRVINTAIQKTKFFGIRGIKIEISGRLNGQEIARTESKTYGKISLQVLKSTLDYAEYSQPSVYGIYGIKIWIAK